MKAALLLVNGNLSDWVVEQALPPAVQSNSDPAVSRPRFSQAISDLSLRRARLFTAAGRALQLFELQTMSFNERHNRKQDPFPSMLA